MSWGKFLLGLVLFAGGVQADVITATYVSSSITCSIPGVQTVTAANSCSVYAPDFASSYGTIFPDGKYDGPASISVLTGAYSPGAETSANFYNSILITGGNGSSDPSNGAYLTVRYFYSLQDNDPDKDDPFAYTVTLGGFNKTFTTKINPDPSGTITTYFQYGVPFDFKLSADVKIDGGVPINGPGYTRGDVLLMSFDLATPVISGGTHAGGVTGNIFVAPEPATPTLLTAGLGLLFFMRKRRAA